MSEIKDRAHAEEIIREIVSLTAEQDGQKAMIANGVAFLEEQHRPAIERLENQIKTREAWLKEWAAVHPEEFVEGRKFIEFQGKRRIGFREGKPYLDLASRVTLPEKIKEGWAQALAIVKRRFKAFVKVETTINKAAILEATKGEKPKLGAAQLAAMGLVVRRDEVFYVSL